jgi:hypothetical protein
VERGPTWPDLNVDAFPCRRVTRGTIAPNEFGLPMGAFLVLAVWCVLGFGVTYAAMTRRG